MDIYTNKDRYEEFINFLVDNKTNLNILDIKQYYIGSLSNLNYNVFEYILKNYKPELGLEYIKSTVELLIEPKYIEIIKLCNNYHINTTFLTNNVITNLIQTNNLGRTCLLEYYEYILYIILGDKEKLLSIIYDCVKDIYNDVNLDIILELIDISVIIGCDKIVIDNSEMSELFRNMNVSKEDININNDVMNVIKKVYNIDNIDTLTKMNKYITKIREDLYIYNDDSNTWCFNNENIIYIKKYNRNPFNSEIIEKRIVENL
jgi:hypothetical protein